MNALCFSSIFLNLYYHHRQDRAQHLDWFSIHGTTGSILLDVHLIYRTATSRHSGQLLLSSSYIFTLSFNESFIFQAFTNHHFDLMRWSTRWSSCQSPTAPISSDSIRAASRFFLLWRPSRSGGQDGRQLVMVVGVGCQWSRRSLFLVKVVKILAMLWHTSGRNLQWDSLNMSWWIFFLKLAHDNVH